MPSFARDNLESGKGVPFGHKLPTATYVPTL